jgi:hypothetical protein
VYRTSEIELFKLRLVIKVAVRSEVWGCGRWIAGCVGLNPSSGMYIRFFYGCVFMCLPDDLSRGFLPIEVCLTVIVEPRNKQAVSHWGCFQLEEKITFLIQCVS